MADKLVVVEDAPEIRDMMVLYLQSAGYEVHATDSGWQCLELVQAQNPALVLLDIGLPDLDGLTVTAQLRRRHPQLGIILVTVRDEDYDRVVGLDAGADGYLTKPLNLNILQAQVRSLLRRCGGTERAGDFNLHLGRFRVDLLRRRIYDPQGQDVNLTPGEFALLIGLIERRGNAISRHDLLHCVRRGQGTDEQVDVRTVDALVVRLRRKLELNANRPQLILTVYGKGYRLATDDELGSRPVP
ncbi:response regulator [Pseudomonas sp. No.21]|uniref:response regulator transcription factor n=1 Tax=Pseudomonas TaxID=286 RepID=UPI000DAA0391|nr:MULTISPECIES: response regulator transcription factor [Pseudomonas]MDW3716193.1 response regulator transcription factor [Pseudomonas sp. 2023EL-01195]PZE10168.1 DNA-binding response regulator [Pseudomonas sp. 57B-090624]GJN50096.1 DNA-binding response regulator [Pseudomonas tohonis]